LVDLIARSRIRRLFGQLHFDPENVGFIISNIYAADIAASLRKRFLLYDCNDDHSSFPGMRSWSETYFNKTSRQADAVFASSQVLLKKVAASRGSEEGCTYLGNGVDYGHFQDGTGVTPSARPRLGYIGALAPWVDFDAIALLAKRRPDWEVILVGPILLGVEDEVMKLTTLPNVFHLPAVAYAKLPSILAQFTLGLIPFRYNALTRGVNPNKLYEYLAAGLPVVATRFSEEVQQFPELARAVDPGDDFVAACDETVNALANEENARRIAEEARRVARENDWNVIADRFWAGVSEMMEAGR